MSQSHAEARKPSDLEENSPRYKCPFCGEAFLSLIELRAHSKAYVGLHLRPVIPQKRLPDIIKVIEDLRDRGYYGYRELDRSS